MFDKIKNEYKDNLLKSFNDSDWVFFKYIIESVPEIMLAYRNKDGDLQLNKDYIALLALLVVSLGPSRELILNMKHAKSLRELYDIVADDAQYATRIGPPSLKLLQLLVSDTWPQLAELFTDDKSTRDLLIKHGDIAEALVPLLRMRGTEDSFKTVLKKYIPYNYFTTTEALMSSTIQVNTKKDFYDNKQLYDLLLWMKPAGYFLNVNDRKLPIFANNLKALITNQSINKQWVKNMSRYMDPLPGAAFAAPTIRDTYTIKDKPTPIEDKPAYLTFQSPSSFTLKTANNQKNWNRTLYYSTDTINWNEWDGTTISSGVGNKLYLRGKGNKIITGLSSGYRWVLTGSNIECIGNIENLLDYETVALGNHPTMSSDCYSYMFYNCKSLTTAPELPATTLASSCYLSMFNGCTSLTTAPELPATTLATQCYYSMFRNCTSLTTAPSLPATTLANYCYENMFYGCTSLTTAPSLPATTLVPYCYANMFYGCTALKVSAEKTRDYRFAWRIPTSGTGTPAAGWSNRLLANTGGTFTGNPSINTIYYVENPPVSVSYPKELYVEFASKIYEDYKAILQATIEYQYDPRLVPAGQEPVIIELASVKTFTNIIPSGDYKTQNISVSLTKPPSHNYVTKLIIKSIKVTLTPIKQSGTHREAFTEITPNRVFSLNNQ